MKENAYRQDLVSVYREGWLITMSITPMCSVSQKLCVRLFTVCKILTTILRILWRHLQTICEMFSALQSTSGAVTDVENSVQIDT